MAVFSVRRSVKAATGWRRLKVGEASLTRPELSVYPVTIKFAVEVVVSNKREQLVTGKEP